MAVKWLCQKVPADRVRVDLSPPSLLDIYCSAMANRNITDDARAYLVPVATDNGKQTIYLKPDASCAFVVDADRLKTSATAEAAFFTLSWQTDFLSLGYSESRNILSIDGKQARDKMPVEDGSEIAIVWRDKRISKSIPSLLIAMLRSLWTVYVLYYLPRRQDMRSVSVQITAAGNLYDNWDIGESIGE